MVLFDERLLCQSNKSPGGRTAIADPDVPVIKLLKKGGQEQINRMEGSRWPLKNGRGGGVYKDSVI